MKNFKILLCTALLSLLLINSAVPALAYTDDDDTMYTMYVNDQQVGIVRFPARALLIYDSMRGVKRDTLKMSSSIPRFTSEAKNHQAHQQYGIGKSYCDAVDVKSEFCFYKHRWKTKICHVRS